MSNLPFEIDEEEKEPEQETLASNVLIVDDEPVVRDVFQRLLGRESDMVVSVAEDAEQGLELIKANRFELLITDKNLPGMGGIELIAEARAVRPMIEAVMITGYASSESLISAFAAGASDYLVKPFDDLKVVRAKVRAALQRRLDRGRSQVSSKEVARQAATMLGQGKDAPEAVWRKLDQKFAEYEKAIREGGSGEVVVVGSDRVVATLSQAGITSRRTSPDSPDVLMADVVIIETGPQLDWHPLAEKLMPLSPDVVLVAGPDADLSDLLEAISLRVDLVGFGGHTPARQLPDRIRANLMRRSVERAQRELAVALSEFKASLRSRQGEATEAEAAPPPATEAEPASAAAPAPAPAPMPAPEPELIDAALAPLDPELGSASEPETLIEISVEMFEPTPAPAAPQSPPALVAEPGTDPMGQAFSPLRAEPVAPAVEPETEPTGPGLAPPSGKSGSDPIDLVSPSSVPETLGSDPIDLVFDPSPVEPAPASPAPTPIKLEVVAEPAAQWEPIPLEPPPSPAKSEPAPASSAEPDLDELDLVFAPYESDAPPEPAPARAPPASALAMSTLAPQPTAPASAPARAPAGGLPTITAAAPPVSRHPAAGPPPSAGGPPATAGSALPATTRPPARAAPLPGAPGAVPPGAPRLSGMPSAPRPVAPVPGAHGGPARAPGMPPPGPLAAGSAPAHPPGSARPMPGAPHHPAGAPAPGRIGANAPAGPARPPAPGATSPRPLSPAGAPLGAAPPSPSGPRPARPSGPHPQVQLPPPPSPGAPRPPPARPPAQGAAPARPSGLYPPAGAPQPAPGAPRPLPAAAPQSRPSGPRPAVNPGSPPGQGGGGMAVQTMSVAEAEKLLLAREAAAAKPAEPPGQPKAPEAAPTGPPKPKPPADGSG